MGRALTRELVADLVPATVMDDFIDDFEASDVNRGYEPSTPHYGYHEVKVLSEVPALLGIEP